MRPDREHGFALVAALFLLVVLAALGAFIVRISTVQHQTVSLAIVSARAYQAARTGVEWGVYQALENGSCGSSSLSLTEAGLAGFAVQVDCSQSDHVEGTANVAVYTIEAFAQTGSYGQPDYVSRRIRATFTDAT